MILNDLSELAASEYQAVIINVGTKSVTTLALLSALKYAEMPVVVIDCESQDESLAHFTGLMKTRDFDLLSAPLKKHGATLDWLFERIASKNVLLVDSDVEILQAEMIRTMKNFVEKDLVFGSGFTHGPCWLPARPDIGYYQERMWIPLTLLNVADVRTALQAGHSFSDRTILNDFAASKLISKIFSLRFRRSFSEKWRLEWLAPFRKSFYGLKPSYVFCDTGADVFQFLKYERGLYFAGFPAEHHEEYATHFHGVTRSLLDAEDANSTNLKDITEQVRTRLREIYEIE